MRADRGWSAEQAGPAHGPNLLDITIDPCTRALDERLRLIGRAQEYMAVAHLCDLLPEVCRNPVERSRLDAIPRGQYHAPFDMRGRAALPEKSFRQGIVVRPSPEILDLGLGKIRKSELDVLGRGNSLADLRCTKARQQDQSQPAGQNHYRTSDHARPRPEAIGGDRPNATTRMELCQLSNAARPRRGTVRQQRRRHRPPHLRGPGSDKLPFIGGVRGTSSVILRALVVAGSRAPDCAINLDRMHDRQCGSVHHVHT
jgi:hypothetical protein